MTTFTDELDGLVVRSNRLGADRSVANWGGGNTSMKRIEKDHTGKEVQILWVKGSGSDLGTMEASQFTALRLGEIEPLMDRNEMADEDMVAYLEKCMVNARSPRASIETLLHAFLPYAHIDHTHPDAIISLCCADNGYDVAREIFGERFVWVPYVRPGFLMSKLILDELMKNPKAEMVLMAKHGLVTWGDTSEKCYNNTINAIQQVEQYIQNKLNHNLDTIYGGRKYISCDRVERKSLATEILPHLRGAVSGKDRMLLTFDDSEQVLEFVNSVDAQSLSQVGAACPDHLIHTKRVPIFIDWDPASGSKEQLIYLIKQRVAEYMDEYIDYFNRYASKDDTMYDPAPRVILVPGIGMFTTGSTKFKSEISKDLYHRAIAVMKGVSVIGEFVSLDEEESFHIEYWPLEVYKLSLAPPDKDFSRTIVLVTGGAGAIGSAVCNRLLADGAHIVIADINHEGAKKLSEELNACYGEGRSIPVYMNVIDESSIISGYQSAVLQYGGVDIVVNNAGLATSTPFEKVSLDEWNLNMSVLGTGYFLVAREGYKLMQQQGIGGNLVFVGSKNSLYAGKDASAYSAAKALEVHLARCIAVEGGTLGIRVNCVLPDAVLQGSDLWSEERRRDRAKVYGIQPEELEEFYRRRTILGENVYPGDVAESVAYLASSRSSKTTGCILTVDAGVSAVFTR